MSRDRRPGRERPALSWWWRWGEPLAATLVGWTWAATMAALGWLALGGAHAVGIAGAQPDPGRGTVAWTASAIALVAPACALTHRRWPLRARLAVAAPVGVAWFVVRFVLPAPEASWPLW